MLRAFIIANAGGMEFAGKRCALSHMNPGPSRVVSNPGNSAETAVLFGDSNDELAGRTFDDAQKLANGVSLSWDHSGYGGVSGILRPEVK